MAFGQNTRALYLLKPPRQPWEGHSKLRLVHVLLQDLLQTFGLGQVPRRHGLQGLSGQRKCDFRSVSGTTRPPAQPAPIHRPFPATLRAVPSEAHQSSRTL